jgi:molybdopterin biosynthesis enzyme
MWWGGLGEERRRSPPNQNNAVPQTHDSKTMKAIAIRKGTTASAAQLEGRIACHDVRDEAGKVAIAKGQVLDAAAAARLLALPWPEVHLLEIEPGDVHEEPAGSRLAIAACGANVEVKGYTGGQWTLAGQRRGLVRANAAALAAVNGLEGMSVFTLYDLQPVEAGEAVAKAKITPLAIPERLVKEAEARAWSAGGLVAVKPFVPRVLGALSRESLAPPQRQRFESSLTEKVDWFGSRLLPVRYAAGDASAMAAEMEGLLAAGADILIAAGAGSLDPLDPVFAGLEHLGGRMIRHGAPAHPGSLLWIAEVRGHAVLGMPACGMFSQATTFDLILPRILAGEPAGAAEVAALGHGGLLSRDSAYRFPPYRKSAARGELSE